MEDEVGKEVGRDEGTDRQKIFNVFGHPGGG